jgi:hypothetical protein
MGPVALTWWLCVQQKENFKEDNFEFSLLLFEKFCCLMNANHTKQIISGIFCLLILTDLRWSSKASKEKEDGHPNKT